MTTIDLSATGTAANRRRSPIGHNKLASIAARPALSNSATAQKLLTRSRGATIVELAAATGWQPHSVRAHLSGLRKKGVNLLREQRKTGEGAYRVANVGAVASASPARNAADPADAARVTDVPDATDAVNGTTAASETTATDMAA